MTSAPTDPHAAPDADPPDSDTHLVMRTRAGDDGAYAELWRRHASAGRAVARGFSSLDSDDLVSESFVRIYEAIGKGRGPTGAFRPYLFTTIRNTAASWGRAPEATGLDTLDLLPDPAAGEDAELAAVDRSLVAEAFRSLPTRWQEMLWYSEVEELTPREIAPLVGMSANSTSALGYRAREGLRQAWIRVHVRSADAPDCKWTLEHLGAHTRTRLGARDARRLDAHLDRCAGCTAAAAEAKHIGSRLALVLLPLAAGLAGAASYAGWLRDGAPVAELAAGAIPLTVLAAGPTTAAAGTGTVGAAGAGGAAGGSGAAGGAAAGAAGVGGAAGAGIGAGVVTAIATGVLVAVVAVGAVVVLPGIQAGTGPEARIASPVEAAGPASSAKEADPEASAPLPAVEPVLDLDVPESEPGVRAEDDAPEPPALPAVPNGPAAQPPATQPPGPVRPEPPITPEPEPEPEPERPDSPVLHAPDTANGLAFPILSGTAAPGAFVTVGTPDGRSLATTADEAGEWSLIVDGLPAGSSDLSVKQTDASGRTSDATVQSVDLLAPVITLTEGYAEIHGAANAVVEIFMNGASLGTVPLDANGRAGGYAWWWEADIMIRYLVMGADVRVGPAVPAVR